MSHTTVKLTIAAVGVAIWLYSVLTENDRLRWVGIAFLAAAFLLRFLRPKPKPEQR